MNKQPLVILTGPTAVGKTELSISLAKKIGGEIISADSMQVYTKMDIGTAKITKEEMDGVPHYLIDVLDPGEDFNVVRFQSMAKEAMKEIYAKGKIPIVVGGTGFYIQALLYDINFDENDADTTYREELETLVKEQGVDVLHDMLRKVDEKSAEAIHKNNFKRVIRALEFHHQTGKKMSEHNEEESQKESAYNSAYFVLTNDRDVLYDRINKRIDIMVNDGLLEEVQALKDAGYKRDLVSMQGLGYKEILQYFDGEITLEEAIYILKRDTRHFAKRQLTWFRREKEVIMVDKRELKETADQLAFIESVLKEKSII
ncbi:MAG: tRNA (adenosine(37)-N6)-dimethylallyltransferase MiaA [bacterium]|nr:tRNA (adenosine(37)-N6)-dimethylallyltransferase MiaA [bacterium]